MLFASEHPLVRHKVALLRHVDTEPKKFRELVRELSMLLCYEATRDLELVDERSRRRWAPPAASDCAPRSA